MFRVSFFTVLFVAAAGSVGSAQDVAPAGRIAADNAAAAERWVEQLVFEHARASQTPLPSPGVRKDDDEAYRRQFDKCRQAFDELTKLKQDAFPVLVAHLEDKRPSIHFRNHYLGHSVGDACYWNLYDQLQDRPENYSSYGYSRKGRDGRNHPKPYWTGSPFNDAGGLKAWLEKHQALSYPEKQIECLTWLLDKEKAIGAPDAASYFKNILPLEIRLLERRAETGADVQQQLTRLRKMLDEKRVDEVPAELLPPRE